MIDIKVEEQKTTFFLQLLDVLALMAVKQFTLVFLFSVFGALRWVNFTVPLLKG